MNLIRCAQGHFYDSDAYGSCPYCINPMGYPQPGPYTAMPGDKTLPPSFGDPDKTLPPSFGNPDKTVSIFNRNAGKSAGGAAETVQPVVGWLVCVKGADYGRDYRLVAGHNFIGRGREMNVNIAGDPGVSRSKHAILTYDPMQNAYFVQPGDSHELCYLNGSVVLEHAMLKPNDRLSLGNTTLLFIPCCSDGFRWDFANGAKNEG